MPGKNLFSKEEGRMDERNEVQQQNNIVIPVIEESVVVEKKWEETGVIRVIKEVEEQTETVDVSLLSEEYQVEHIAINRYVDDEVPQARYEEDVLVLPVVKEVIVKRLLLIEEVRIKKRTSQRTEQHNVTLRKETVSVMRAAATDEKGFNHNK